MFFEEEKNPPLNTFKCKNHQLWSLYYKKAGRQESKKEISF